MSSSIVTFPTDRKVNHAVYAQCKIFRLQFLNNQTHFSSSILSLLTIDPFKLRALIKMIRMRRECDLPRSRLFTISPRIGIDACWGQSILYSTLLYLSTVLYIDGQSERKAIQPVHTNDECRSYTTRASFNQVALTASFNH
ncbi:hypothetical protein BLOT_008936 [Blomia tropicalis]|nr:hypothetical protein BLOT_008936 [Blomia tropicalis]